MISLTGLDYGVALHIKPSTMQWRIPVGIQMIPGGLMLIGLFFLKESPRWLTKKGRHQEAAKSLAWVRCATVDDPDVLLELAEVRASIEEELNSTEGVTWKECLQPGSRKRFFIAFMSLPYYELTLMENGNRGSPCWRQCKLVIVQEVEHPIPAHRMLRRHLPFSVETRYRPSETRPVGSDVASRSLCEWRLTALLVRDL